jgi:hypothetical protein
MDTQNADLNPTPAELASAQRNESVEISKSEGRVDKDHSYLRSRQIALKKFIPQEEEPS